MIRETVKYVDFNDVERVESHDFHFTKTELTDMHMHTPGGLDGLIRKIINEKDQTKLYDLVKELILKSYGEKSADGRSFIKKRPDGTLLADEFAQTQAFDELFTTLGQDAKKLADFVNGIMPKKLRDEVEKEMKEHPEKFKDLEAEIIPINASAGDYADQPTIAPTN